MFCSSVIQILWHIIVVLLYVCVMAIIFILCNVTLPLHCLYTAENIMFSCQGTANLFKRVMNSNQAFKLKLSPWSTPHLLLLWPHPSQFLWQCPRQPWPGRVSRWHRLPPWRLSFPPAAAAPLWLPCGRAAPPQTPSWYPPVVQTDRLRHTKNTIPKNKNTLCNMVIDIYIFFFKYIFQEYVFSQTISLYHMLYVPNLYESTDFHLKISQHWQYPATESKILQQ